jgi:hypothetical protein
MFLFFSVGLIMASTRSWWWMIRRVGAAHAALYKFNCKQVKPESAERVLWQASVLSGAAPSADREGRLP